MTGIEEMDLEIAKKALESGIKFVANCGLKVVELRRGYVKCLMPYAGDGNHIGTMYAGALFTLAEIPGGALFSSSFDARSSAALHETYGCATLR